ncbi:hypothetical protein H072_4889 [Dactylellina haptotyla CBS 200.50]|uniref:Uncharacterized protein n=1 Tax=Dactylellina haptotyla (strain CBS 200.50) TaxID=1284197 RepID=S8AJ98_DACHA|nr:hypothetical protein H072_4889 [Dactylellina haptotyla CBS 200.50]
MLLLAGRLILTETRPLDETRTKAERTDSEEETKISFEVTSLSETRLPMFRNASYIDSNSTLLPTTTTGRFKRQAPDSPFNFPAGLGPLLIPQCANSMSVFRGESIPSALTISGLDLRNSWQYLQSWGATYEIRPGDRGAELRVLRIIETQQSRCIECECTPEGLLTTSDSRLCRSPDTVNWCVFRLGCYCTAILLPKPTATGVSVEDYSDILDLFAASSANDQPAAPASRKKSGFQLPQGAEVIDLDSPEPMGYRRLVPGTKEPYYVEGPGPSSHNRDWLGRLGIVGSVDVGKSD